MPVPADVFAKIPERFDADRAGDLEAIYQFDLSGDNGGQWAICIANGGCEVVTGSLPNPTTTLKMKDEDYVALALGDLDPMLAFMRGKVKVSGDYVALYKFQSLFVD